MDEPRVDNGPLASVADDRGTVKPSVQPRLGTKIWVVVPPPPPGPAIVYGPPEDPVAFSRKPPAGWQELDQVGGTRGAKWAGSG